MHSPYHFRYIAGSGDTRGYEFWHQGKAGRIEVRYRMPDLRKLMEPVEAEYREQINSIYRFYHDTLPFTAEFVQAFNDWEMGDHLEQVSQMQAMPGTYGTWAEIEHLCPPPIRVRGIVWKDGKYEPIAA